MGSQLRSWIEKARHRILSIFLELEWSYLMGLTCLCMGCDFHDGLVCVRVSDEWIDVQWSCFLSCAAGSVQIAGLEPDGCLLSPIV